MKWKKASKIQANILLSLLDFTVIKLRCQIAIKFLNACSSSLCLSQMSDK